MIVVEEAGADAGPPAVPRFGTLGMSACLIYPDAPPMCARALDTLAFHPVGSEPVIETATPRECLLTKSGAAVCGGVTVARDVRSVTGAPYLLGTKDVLIAPTEHEEKDDGMRTTLAASLPALERIVATELASCALTKDEKREVWCWNDPSFGFSRDVEAPEQPMAKAVPRQRDIVEIALSPWLTLCTRSKIGVVMCSSGAASATQVCELSGTHDVRCGRERRGPMGPPPLVGPSYDPRTVIQRPLVAVPELDGTDAATSLRMWIHQAKAMLESGRRLYTYAGDEGGCALLASGAVRCFARDVCKAGVPWRSTLVEGLPTDITRIELAAWHGYAITRGGALYTWKRHAPEQEMDCPRPSIPLAMRAERLFEAGIVDVGGVLTRPWRAMGSVGIDCAIASNAEVTCWQTTDAHERKPIMVERSTEPPPKEF